MTSAELPRAKVVEEVESIWGTPLHPAGCEVCGQAHLVEEMRVGSMCPNCGKGILNPQPAVLRPEPPEMVILFKIERDDLPSVFLGFVKGVWLRPDEFNPATLFKRAVPVLIPMWLVDGDVVGAWQAEVGFDYQVKSSQESYVNGSWQTHEVIETRARWEPRTGLLTRHYDNVAVPALSDHNELIERVGDFQLEASTAYSPTLIVGADLRVPDLQPGDMWLAAKDNLNRVAAGECQQAASAQHIRNFSIDAEYRSLNWTQLMLPVFLSYYKDDDGNPQLIFINGQSRWISGARLASQRKGWKWAGIMSAVGIAVFLFGVLVTLLGAMLTPLVVVGLIFIALSFIFGLSAIIPAVYPWQHNRKQQVKKVYQK